MAESDGLHLSDRCETLKVVAEGVMRLDEPAAAVDAGKENVRRMDSAVVERGWRYFLAAACVPAALACAAAQQPALSHLSHARPAEAEELQAARVLIEANHFADAEKKLRAFLLLDDRSGEAHELLGYALLRLDKPKDSLSEYTRAAKLERPSADMLVHVGQDYALLGDDVDADKWTLQAVRMDPKDADAWYGLGRIRYTRQKFADALSCFQQVLMLLPKSIKAENNLGLTYEALNQPDNAVAAYRQAIAWQQAEPVKERSEQPLLNLGTMLVHQGRLAEAEQLLVEAADIAPANARVHEQLGHLALQKGDYNTAQREFARTCELDPGKSSLHFLLGQAYKHLGRQKEAEAEFALASRLAHETAAPALQ